MEKPEYFDCQCHSPDHTLRMWLDDEPDFACVYISAFLGNDGFFNRVWNALKYVFGHKCRYGHFDEFMLQPEDADRFIAVLERLKKAKGS